MSTSSSIADLSAYQPHPDGLTEPFWQGASAGQLILSRCPACRLWQHPPLASCRRCATPLEPESAPLLGTIYSFTTTYHSAIPLFPPPFVVAIVEIGFDAEPPRIVVRVLASPGDVQVGGRVCIEMDHLPGGPFNVPVARLM